MKVAAVFSIFAVAALAAPAPVAEDEVHPIGSEEWYKQFQRAFSSDSTHRASALDAEGRLVHFDDRGSAYEKKEHEIAQSSQKGHDIARKNEFEGPNGVKRSSSYSNKAYDNRNYWEKSSHEKGADFGEQKTVAAGKVSTKEAEATQSVRLHELMEAAYRYIMEACPTGQCLEA